MQLKAGVQIIIEAARLAEKNQNVDLVITGKGQMDAQSIVGKTPADVAKTSKQFGNPVIAVAYVKTILWRKHSIYAFFPIIRQLGSLDEGLKSGRKISHLLLKMWRD